MTGVGDIDSDWDQAMREIVDESTHARGDAETSMSDSWRVLPK